VLAADRLMQSPRLYSTFLLWLLSELFEHLPEVGDLDKPKFVFFFDEAHLLFNDAPKALLERIEQVVRLIRSKGVGVYFITQNPTDVPQTVLGQLGNRVQHALRAFTPNDQKAVKVAAETFRPNPKFKAIEAIGELAVGEALVSFLDAKGVPSPVERCFIAPPRSRIGTLTEAERLELMRKSAVGTAYDQPEDRESAYEKLKQRVASDRPTRPWDSTPAPEKPRTSRSDSLGTVIAKSATRTATTVVVREAIKQVFRVVLGTGSRSHSTKARSNARADAGVVGQVEKYGPAVLRGVLGSILRR